MDKTLKQSNSVVPQAREDRDLIRGTIDQFVEKRKISPPQPFAALRKHAESLVRALNLSSDYYDFATILISNAIWRDTLAAVPFDRRLLFLPQYLRRQQECPAEVTDYGLLCENCGNCELGELVREAERLGYTVLVADGSALVSQLFDQKKVDAIISVGSLTEMDRSFPHLTADAVPGITVPLLKEECDGSELDLDRLEEAIHLESKERWEARVDIESVRRDVSSWFTNENIREIVDWGESTTETIGLNWMSVAGKRWRPLLATCIYRVLAKMGDLETPSDMKRLAIAVECFHKASLVHDDIEDDDDFRYGERTLHTRYGVPVALNVGDYLLGEGYRIIAETAASPMQSSRMMAVAADGHRGLALGQGRELAWVFKPEPLTTETVLEIFRYKTAPAFEVALSLGAIYAGASETTCTILSEFSRSLGIAYQIQDDLKDYLGDEDPSDGEALRPNIMLALAYEAARGKDRKVLESIWAPGDQPAASRADIIQTVRRLGVHKHALQLFKHYRSQAIRDLNPLRNSHLKNLLHQLTGRILTGA